MFTPKYPYLKAGSHFDKYFSTDKVKLHHWQFDPSKQPNFDLRIFTTMNDEMFGVPSKTFNRSPANVMASKMYIVATLGNTPEN